MKHITFIILLLSSLTLTAQNDQEQIEKEFGTMKEQIEMLQVENEKLKSEVKTLKKKVSGANISIEYLKQESKENTAAIEQTANNLGLKINTSETKSKNEIAAVAKSLSNKTLWGIIAVLLAMIISGIIYYLLQKKQKIDKSDWTEQLSKTKTAIEESLIKEFGKQTELIETQLIEKQKNVVANLPNVVPDHSLALKIASEINLIERNTSLMDATTKGLKQLTRSVGKIKDNLVANGYEMPELLGKQFHQGMKVIVTSSIPDENLESGSEIITKVLIPQVNYNDIMIQTAQIEVSVGQ